MGTVREIKFRAWWKSQEKILDWGDVRRNLNIAVIAEAGEDVDYELMQYTGLKDKNGREIYEGDIVRVRQPWNTNIPEIVDEVVCNGPTDWSWGPFGNIFQALTYDDDTEVIGNIYENSELLGD
jgi:hypothetical protein